jgi:hypothetical protein
MIVDFDQARRDRQDVLSEEANGPGLRNGGGGGTSDDMDDWKASVEARLGDLRADIRELRNWLAGGIGFVLLALAGGFFFLLTHINAASDKADAQLTALREGQVRIETMLAERLPPKK